MLIHEIIRADASLRDLSDAAQRFRRREAFAADVARDGLLVRDADQDAERRRRDLLFLKVGCELHDNQ